jgi:hypothetical protein
MTLKRHLFDKPLIPKGASVRRTGHEKCILYRSSEPSGPVGTQSIIRSGKMLSTLELRNIIESSFLPMRCQCTQATDRSLTVRVYDRRSERVDLTVTGIKSEQLTSSRAISNLIAGLRADLHVNNTRQQRRASDSL